MRRDLQLMSEEEMKEEEFNLKIDECLAQFDKRELLIIRNFVNERVKTFRKLRYAVDDRTDRVLSEHVKHINKDKRILCRIYNCEDVKNFSKADLEITFKIYDKLSYSTDYIQVNGSGKMGGCTLSEAREFLEIIEDTRKGLRHM